MICKVVSLRIRLLEDLHSGSGLGSGSIDSTQARDRDGRPVLWWSHLKGVLRAVAEDLQARGSQGIDPIALFGWDSRTGTGPKTGRISVGSAYVDEDASLPRARWSLVWSSTARELNSRMPLEDTKRSDEYISVGCEFVARCELPDSDVAALRAVAEATSRLGAKRSRGALVSIAVDEHDYAGTIVPSDSPTSTLRLRLRARDPLCFPTTPAAGNIVDSQHFIPGSALLGAIVNAIMPAQAPEADPLVQGLLDARVIHVGNGYPLPLDFPADALSDLELMPAPLSHRQSKHSARDSAVPDWALPTSGSARYLDDGQDQLLRTGIDVSDGKRLADDAYVLRPSRKEAWRLYRSPLMQRMRIGAPDIGWQETKADAADLRNRQDLFTTEEIPERTEFVADIVFEDRTLASSFAQQLSARAGDLRLGRGGRLVEIVSAAWVDRKAHAPADSATDSLRMVLESDLILRGPRLGFVTQLDRPALARLLADAGLDVSMLDELTVDAVADTTAIGGFNASSGLPRAAQAGLRRGSAALVRGSAMKLESLRAALASRLAWGERTHEGFGRLRTFSDDWGGTLPQDVDGAARSSARQPRDDEAIADQARQMIESQQASVARLFSKLGKSNIYDFVSLAKSAPENFEIRFRAAWEHYAKRKDLGVAAEVALAELKSGAAPADKVAQATRRLYYAARWAIALGKYGRADNGESDGSNAAESAAATIETETDPEERSHG